MANLLAILLSLAMLLTGATAPVAEPVSRTLQVSNITVRHNDEEVTLSPYASLGLTTDGESALLDFFIGNGDDTYLPFQVSVNEDGLLVQNDNANVTLSIGKDQIDEVMGGVEMDEESQQVFTLLGDYFSAYAELLKLMDDPDEMREIQARGDEIYDGMVDRGDSEVGSVEYDGETYQVDIYEYDLTGAQIGALTDAIYASNEKLANFAEVYFRLLAALPEDSGLSGFDSFESLLENFDFITMHVSESIAENGLNVSDIVLEIAVPNMEEPLELVVHSVSNGDERTSEIATDVDIDGVTVNVYGESEQTGGDMSLNLDVTVNPSDDVAAEENDGAIPDDEDEDDEDEDDYDDDDDDVIVDGEGDGQDMVAFNLDFDRSYDEDEGTYSQSLGYALDLAEQDVHMEFAIEGDDEACQMTGELDIGDEIYGIDLTATVSDDPIDARIEADKAVSMDAFDPNVLVASVSADALNLYTDESVQKLIAMAQSAMEAASSVEPLDIDVAPSEDVEDVDDVIEPEVYETSGADDGAAEETLGTPTFGWIPEGYALTELTVDDEYPSANAVLSNEETGDSLYIYMTMDVSFYEALNQYVLDADGGIEPIEGFVLSEEIGDGYRNYIVDDGTMTYSVYPINDDVPVEDIARILTSISIQ